LLKIGFILLDSFQTKSPTEFMIAWSLAILAELSSSLQYGTSKTCGLLKVGTKKGLKST
jgi:hypothetical protein